MLHVANVDKGNETSKREKSGPLNRTDYYVHAKLEFALKGWGKAFCPLIIV